MDLPSRQTLIPHLRRGRTQRGRRVWQTRTSRRSQL